MQHFNVAGDYVKAVSMRKWTNFTHQSLTTILNEIISRCGDGKKMSSPDLPSPPLIYAHRPQLELHKNLDNAR